MAVNGTGRYQSWRSFAAFALLLVLAGCTVAGQPFGKSNNPLVWPAGHKAPTVNITGITGLSPDRAKLVSQALIKAGARRGIPVTAKPVARAMTLAGTFGVHANGQVTYRWTLRDSHGEPVHQILARETIEGSADVKREVWQRIADYSAESLSSRLAQLGYATQTRGVTPPPDAFARAGPNAETEIDFETLNGPYTSSLPPPGAHPAPPPAAQPPQPPVEAPRARPEPKEEASPRQRKRDRQRKPGGTSIGSVAITGVTGSPGGGNRELAAAMRDVLTAAGWPVRAKPGKDSLRIEAKVRLSRPKAGKQTVTLIWTVRLPDGKKAGAVRQQNAVPAGSLDTGWGGNAQYAARAAASGIAKLVDKLR